MGMGSKLDRLAPFLPWRGANPATQPAAGPWWARIPAHLSYILGTSALFLVYLIAFGRRREAVPQSLYELFVYEAPALFTEPLRTGINLVTAVWLNTHPVQVLYVFTLLVLFGIPFELREGSRRAVLVFYGSSIGAGILAGALLNFLHRVSSAAWVEDAWMEPWTGGSAGAFGLMGAFAARAAKPWPLLVLFTIWEINIEIWHLKSYTPAFHFIALGLGFLVVRFRWRRNLSLASPAPGTG